MDDPIANTAVIYQVKREDLKALFKEFLNEAKTTVYDPNLFKGEDRLSQKEAAEFLEVTIPTIIAWKKTEGLPHLKVGKNKFLFSKKLLLQYMYQTRNND